MVCFKGNLLDSSFLTHHAPGPTGTKLHLLRCAARVTSSTPILQSSTAAGLDFLAMPWTSLLCPALSRNALDCLIIFPRQVRCAAKATSSTPHAPGPTETQLHLLRCTARVTFSTTPPTDQHCCCLGLPCYVLDCLIILPRQVQQDPAARAARATSSTPHPTDLHCSCPGLTLGCCSLRCYTLVSFFTLVRPGHPCHALPGLHHTIQRLPQETCLRTT